MEIHHLGFACRDIPQAIEYLKSIYKIKEISNIIYDELQDGNVCLITLQDSSAIELVSGTPVKKILQDSLNEYQFYHVCYEVDDLEQAIVKFKQKSAVPISDAKPAKLFNGRRVLFMQSPMGLIELLESEKKNVYHEVKPKDDEKKLFNDAENIIVSSNFNIEPILEYLKNISSELNWNINLQVASYNQILQQIHDSSSLFNQNTNGANIIIVRMIDWLRFHDVANDKDAASIINTRNAELVLSLKDILNKRVPCIVIITSTESKVDSALSIIIEEAENSLLAALKNINGICGYKFNISNYLNQTVSWYDKVSDEIGHIPYLTSFYGFLALDLLRKYHAIKRKPYKAIIVDCDNTLWDGVSAEVGYNNVLIGDERKAFQKKLIELNQNGMQLFVSSKNNLEDVLNVFDKNNDMVLKKENVLDWQVNWGDKSSNIIKFSEKYKIALSDMIFIDDNPAEIAEVRHNCPQLLVLHLDPNKNILGQIKTFWAFDQIYVTEEDRHRNHYYAQNKIRDEIKKSSNTFDDFIKKLDLKLTIESMSIDHIQRVAQLTERTNQFNFTSKRRSVEELNMLIRSGYHCLTVTAKDKYGDYGLIGVIIYQLKNNSLEVDSFLMSCRVLGRKIENKMMSKLGEVAKKEGVRYVKLVFKKSDRNQPALNFIESLIYKDKVKLDDDSYYYLIDVKNAAFVRKNPNQIKINEEENKSIFNAKDNLRERDNIIISKSNYSFDVLSQLVNEPTDNIKMNNPNSVDIVDIKKHVKSIICNVLKLNDLDYNKNIFEVGCDSLKVTQIISRIYILWNIELKIRDVYVLNTIRLLAEQISGIFLTEKEQIGIVPIRKFITGNVGNLSFSQNWLWFMDQVADGAWYYNMPVAMRLKGIVNLDALKQAFKLLFDRHAVLRTRFLAGEQIKQKIEDNFELPFTVLEAKRLSGNDVNLIVNEEFKKPFNLQTDIPIRITIIKLKPNEFILVIVNHHIISDGWSYSIIYRELSQFYNSIVSNKPILMKELPINYIDYVEWEKLIFNDNKSKTQFDYWMSKLENLPNLNLPTDFPLKSRRTHEGKYQYFEIDENLSLLLKDFSIKTNSSLYGTLLSIYAVFISKLARLNDVVIVSPVSNRLHPQLENMIGCFVNLIAIRTQLDDKLTFLEFALKTKEVILNARDNQEIPFERVVGGVMERQKHPQNFLFQIMFAMQNTQKELLSFDSIQASYYRRGYDAARLELILELEEENNKIVGGFYYNDNLFSSDTINKFIFDYLSFAKLFMLTPECMLDIVINPQEEITNTLNTLPYNSLSEWFEAQAKANPCHEAISCAESVITYAELNALANKISNYIAALGVLRQNRVGLALKPSIISIASIIACQKLSVTYVPLDLNAPSEYLSQIVNQSQLKLILIDSELKDRLDLISINTQIFPIDNELVSQFPELIVDHSPKINDLAYIIYTSGTTGIPKGVMVENSNLVSLFLSTKNIYNFSSEDKTVLFHSLAFDFSVWEIWSALCYGSKLIILPLETIRSPDEFYELLFKEKITVINQTPTAFKRLMLYVDNCKNILNLNLRLVILGGEHVIPKDLLSWSKLYPFCNVYNMYGITEGTVHATYLKLNEFIPYESRSLIGNGLPNVEVYILNQDLTPCKIGETGEIYLGGAGLARGYFGQPSLTNEMFIINPFNKNERLYRTKDLACHTHDSNIEFKGRQTNYAKISGYRVELTGIIATLSQHQAVRLSHVIVDEKNHNLIAYIIPDKNHARSLYVQAKVNELSKLNNNKLFVLPNQTIVHYLNRSEAQFMYDEIYEYQEYYHPQIILPENGIVFDIGANIGLFSLWCHSLQEHIKVHAFEPISHVYEVLKKNLELHAINHMAHNFAISTHNHEAEFNYFPNVSVMSSYKNNLNKVKVELRKFLDKMMGDNNTTLNSIDIDNHIEEKVQYSKMKCKLLSLSEVILDQNIKKIDLLKIDVEGAEIEVLNGIHQNDWPKIDQFIIEVEDNDTVEEIIKILNLQGLSCYVRTNQYTVSNYKIIFASRLVQLSDFTQADLRSLVSTKYPDAESVISEIRQHMQKMLPHYMVPAKYKFAINFPLTINGKINYEELDKISYSADPSSSEIKYNLNDKQENIRKYLLKTWSEVLGIKEISTKSNFFDIGGNSFLIMHVFSKIDKEYPNQLRIVDLFKYLSIDSLAEYLANKINISPSCIDDNYKHIQSLEKIDNSIAIIGLAGRFPGANNVDDYWDNLVKGVNSIKRFTEDEMSALGISSEIYKNPDYINAVGMVENIDLFDADFFSFTPKEAIVADPQQRCFMELAYHALENAGYSSQKYNGKIGVYAGMGNSHYLEHILKNVNDKDKLYDSLFIEIGHEKDYLASRVAYKLGLTGEALNINTACSTSLVAIIKACQSLVSGENDIVLAGGISLLLPERTGYFYVNNGILSPDGYCRPFDINANGTVFGSGAGIVVLKRLSDALQDGDTIKLIIRGYAINNDGLEKLSFTAPSPDGQTACIKKAFSHANISPSQISHVESHGTGTLLGDPIEVSALTSAFGNDLPTKQYCTLGSVKANIGHPDAAAGIASLIKVIMMADQRTVPPMVNYRMPNQLIDFSQTPFYVNKQKIKWGRDSEIVYGGISSFGVGGTNAHMIVQSVPHFSNSLIVAPPQLIILSAKTVAALNQKTIDLRNYLLKIIDGDKNYPSYLADVAYTLQVGRQDFDFRRCYLCVNVNDCIEKLLINTNVLPQSLIANNISLVDAANKWLSGHPVDWFQFHEGSVRKRVPLPGYPFERRSYWYTHLNKAKTFDKSQITSTDLSFTYLIDELKKIFKEILGYNHISEEDNFFKLGGDSFLTLILLTKIQDVFSVRLTFDDIYQSPTILQMTELLLKATNSNKIDKYLIKLREGSPEFPPMYFIHPPNGSLIHYYPLIQNIIYEGIIYGIQNPPLDNDIITFPSINELAKLYSSVISNISTGPCVLAGWSFGGNVAFEIVRQLEHAGKSVINLFLIDSWSKFSALVKNKKALNDILDSRDNYRKYIKSVKNWENVIWNRFNKLLEYAPQVINTPVTLFKANELYDEYLDVEDSTNHWKDYCTNLTVHNIKANHESIVIAPATIDVANIISESLNADIDCKIEEIT